MLRTVRGSFTGSVKPVRERARSRVVKLFDHSRADFGGVILKALLVLGFAQNKSNLCKIVVRLHGKRIQNGVVFYAHVVPVALGFRPIDEDTVFHARLRN